MRGAGVVGRGGADATGGAGAAGVALAGGAGGAAGALGRTATGGATTARGGADGGAAGGGAAGAAGALGVFGVVEDAGGAGGRMIGAGGRTVCGVMNRGAGAGLSGSAGFAGTGGVAGADGATGVAAAGLASGGAGRGGMAVGRGAAGGAAPACCFCWMSFSTSPGLEIWERSIFILISSLSRPARAPLLVDPASDALLKCTRTFSASKSSNELECVFFSVTPTSGNTSRIALLLTSSSLARSLIRILLIRPFLLRHRSLSLHCNLIECALLHRPTAGAAGPEDPLHDFGSAESVGSTCSDSAPAVSSEPGSGSSPAGAAS